MKRLRKQMETIYWSPVLKVGVDEGRKLVFVEVAEPSSAEDLISSMEDRPESFETTMDLPDVIVRIGGVTGKEDWFRGFLELLKATVLDWVSEMLELEDPDVTIYKEPGVFGDTISLDIRVRGKLPRGGGTEFLRSLKRVKELVEGEDYLNHVRNAVNAICRVLKNLGFDVKIDPSRIEVVPKVGTKGKPFGWKPPYETVLTEVPPEVRHLYDTRLVHISYVLDFGHISDEEFGRIIETLRRGSSLDDIVSSLISLVRRHRPEIDFWMTEEEIEEFEDRVGESVEEFSDFVGVLEELKSKLGGRMLRKQNNLQSRLNTLREFIQNSLESEDIDDEMEEELNELLDKVNKLSEQGNVTDNQVRELEERYKKIVGEGTVVRPLRPVVREMMGEGLSGVGVPPSVTPVPEHLETVPTGPGVMWVKKLRKRLIKILRDTVRKRLR